MHDEYNHKQRLMETYVGFKDNNGEDDLLQEKLKTIIVNTVADNPNKHFKREKSLPEKLIDKSTNTLSKGVDALANLGKKDS